MIKHSKQNILIIYGPNMNLLGLRKVGDRVGITLDKLNRHLRKAANERGLSITIFQTNDESSAVNQLQRQLKKIKGILMFPGPWQQSGYVIKDTLEILSIPYITISLEEKVDVLKGGMNIDGINYIMVLNIRTLKGFVLELPCFN